MNICDLAQLRPVLGDGAVGTMLLQRGLRMGMCPEAWNLEESRIVMEIHRAYKDAGCDFVETNTLGANSIRLARYGLDSKLDAIVAGGVALARRAVADACLVAGSVGPTGGLLEPYGELSPEEVADVFRNTARAMEQAGVDFFLIETMTDINEASLAISAIKDVSTKPILATMVFSKTTKGYRTVMGTPPQEAASRLISAGADFVGTNCCNGVGEAIDIMADMAQAAPRATVAQPNAGLPEVQSGTAVYPETPEAMAEGTEQLLANGVRIIGGCCGTTPAHIRAMGSVLARC